jgi:predicted MPP superfamily phosphohydrolase
LKRLIKYFLIIIIIIISLILYVFIDNSTVATTKYEIKSNQIPKSFDKYKIAFICDFHDSNNFDQIVKKTKNINPNVILLGGDIINMHTKDSENSLKLLLGLKKISPIYFIKGNHENFNSNYYKNFSNDLENLKIPILLNKTVLIEKNNDQIALTGMNDPYLQDNEIENSKFIENFKEYTKNNIDFNKFNILLTHRSNIFPFIAGLDYNLILSGHLHGGLVRFPILGGLFSPDLKTPPTYTSGLYKIKNSTMIVNRGCNENSNRVRVFNGPEILNIELISSK